MGSNWKGLLTRVKGPQKHMDKGVVYQIPSAQSNVVYIGETGRSLKTRITEHKRAVATECQCYPLDEDKLQHGLGAGHVVDRSNR